MQAAVRPYLNAGVAIVGASVIAVAPVVVTPPDMDVSDTHMSSAAVTLTASTDPIEAWLGLVTSTLGNATALAGLTLQDPAPLLKQFLANQIGYAGATLDGVGQGIKGLMDYYNPSLPGGFFDGLKTALTDLEAGDLNNAFVGFISNSFILPVLVPVLPVLLNGGELVEIPTKIAQNLANVVAALTNPTNLVPLGFGGLATALGPVNAVGDSLQEVFNGLTSVDPVKALSALAAAPANVLGSLINGYTDLDGNFFQGLLTVGDPNNPIGAGIIQSLLNIPKIIAQAIAPAPITAALTATPEPKSLVAATDPANPGTGSGTLVKVTTMSAADRGTAVGASATGGDDTGAQTASSKESDDQSMTKTDDTTKDGATVSSGTSGTSGASNSSGTDTATQGDAAGGTSKDGASAGAVAGSGTATGTDAGSTDTKADSNRNGASDDGKSKDSTPKHRKQAKHRKTDN